MSSAKLVMSTPRSERTWSDGFPIPPWRRGLAGAILYVANAMVMLDMTIANVAVPHIAGNLGATLEQGTWVITSYAVAEAVAVPLTGWLVSRFGVVQMALVAITGFTIMSLCCGLAMTLPVLVACRVLQGLCGGLILPLAQTMIFRIYPVPQIPRAMMIWMLTVMVSPAAGPIIGGMIVDGSSWHWIFLINVPVGIAAVAAGYVVLRPAESEKVRLRVDWPGIMLLFVWVGALQLMLDTGRDKDWFSDWSIVALGVIAAVSLLAFVVWELTDEHPIVDVRRMGHYPFAMTLVCCTFVFGAYFSGIVIVPQWLQAVMGYSATQAGLITATMALTSMISSQICMKMMLRIDARLVVTIGGIWAAGGLVLRTIWSTEIDTFHLAATFAVQGFGVTMMMMPLSNMVMSTIPLQHAATGTGLFNFFRTLSSAVGAAIALTFWSDQQGVARDSIVQALHYDRALADLASAGLNEGGRLAYVSALVDRQAITVAMLHTFAAAAVAVVISTLAIWTVPYVELTRLKGPNAQAAQH